MGLKNLSGKSEEGCSPVLKTALKTPSFRASMAPGRTSRMSYSFIGCSVDGDTQRQLQLDSDTSLLKEALKASLTLPSLCWTRSPAFSETSTSTWIRRFVPVVDASPRSVTPRASRSSPSSTTTSAAGDVDALQKILGASSLVGAVVSLGIPAATRKTSNSTS